MPAHLDKLAVLPIEIQSPCVGEGFVSRPHLLGEVHRGSHYLSSGKLRGRRNCLKVMKNEKRKIKVMKRSRKSERTLPSCMHGDDHGMEWGAHSNILSHAMCARNECGNTEQGLRRLQHYAQSHVFWSLLSFMLWILVFTLSLVLDASTSSKMVSFVNCISPRIRNTKCKVLSFWILQSDCVLSSSTQSVFQILAYFTSAKRVF